MPSENVGQAMHQIAETPQLKSSLSRQRFGELVQLGLKASEELTKHGLQRNEYCEFGQIMQKIMQLE